MGIKVKPAPVVAPAKPLGPPHYRGPTGNVKDAEACALVERLGDLRKGWMK